MGNGFSVGIPWASPYNRECNAALMKETMWPKTDHCVTNVRTDIMYNQNLCSCQVQDWSTTATTVNGNCLNCLKRCGTVAKDSGGEIDITMEGTCPSNAPFCEKGSYKVQYNGAADNRNSDCGNNNKGCLGTAYCTPHFLGDYDAVDPLEPDICDVNIDNEKDCVGSYYNPTIGDLSYCEWKKQTGGVNPDEYKCQAGGKDVTDSRVTNTGDKYNKGNKYFDAKPFPYFCDVKSNTCKENTVPTLGARYNDSGKLYPDLDLCQKHCGNKSKCTDTLNSLCGSTTTKDTCKTCVGKNQDKVVLAGCSPIQIDDYCNQKPIQI